MTQYNPGDRLPIAGAEYAASELRRPGLRVAAQDRIERGANFFKPGMIQRWQMAHQREVGAQARATNLRHEGEMFVHAIREEKRGDNQPRRFSARACDNRREAVVQVDETHAQAPNVSGTNFHGF